MEQNKNELDYSVSNFCIKNSKTNIKNQYKVNNLSQLIIQVNI